MGWRLRPWFALFFALAGCSSPPEVPPYDQDPVLATAATPEAGRRPLTLAVAPVDVAYDSAAINEARDDGDRFSHGVDGEALRSEATDVLRQLGPFSGVTPLPGSSAPPIEAAWSERADLVLQMRVTDCETVYVGAAGTWIYILNLINWAAMIFPAWYVRDETYQGDIDVDVTLTAVGSEREVLRVPIRGTARLDLADADHGPQLLGPLTTPSSFDEENWRRVRDIVMPFAFRDFYSKLLVLLGAELSERRLDAALEQTFVLSVGVVAPLPSTVSERALHADRDATAFVDYLARQSGIEVPERNVRLLVRDSATRGAVLAALDDLAARAGPMDTLFIYFAGLGASGRAVGGAPAASGQRLYLLTHGSEAARLPETALPLDEIAQRLGETRARDVVVILDTSFGGPAGTRTLSTARATDRGAVAAALQALAVRPGCAVLAASAPEQGALAYDSAGQGLFTHELLAAAGDDSIRTPDGSVPLRAAFERALAQTDERSALLGASQTPRLYGNLRPEILIRRPPERPPVALGGAP